MKRIRASNNALASVRYRLNLTQVQMSLKLGTSVSLVKLVETGRRSLPLEPFLKLAKLEIELSAAMRNDDYPTFSPLGLRKTVRSQSDNPQAPPSGLRPTAQT